MELDIESIKELSEKGEKDYNLEDTLDVPHGEEVTTKTFKIEDIEECFNKIFAIRELISLVGSTVIHKDEGGNDVDLVLSMSDLSEDLQTAVKFRLMRGFSSYFNIPYEKVPEYLHLHEKESAESSFTDYLSLYKLALIPVPDDERTIRKMSLSDESDSENFEILEKSKDFIIGGIVSDISEDLEQERITPKALKQIWESIQKTPKEFRGLFDSHNSTCVGSLIPNYKKYRCALIDDSKLFLIFKLRQDIPIAQKIMEAIKSGELKNFSIKFGIKNPKKNIKEVCDEENQCVTEIRGGTYYIETSLTPNPSNKNTSLEVLSKEKK